MLGCLLEKERLTPENYPISLNSLTAACNQSTNRDPVTAYDERTVDDGLTALREKKLAVMIHAAGSRVQKYRHNLPAHYELQPREVALLCVLMLRGPQTPGELRIRTERFHSFASPGRGGDHVAGARRRRRSARAHPARARRARRSAGTCSSSPASRRKKAPPPLRSSRIAPPASTCWSRKSPACARNSGACASSSKSSGSSLSSRFAGRSADTSPLFSALWISTPTPLTPWPPSSFGPSRTISRSSRASANASFTRSARSP